MPRITCAPVSTVGQQSSPLCVAEDVAAAASDGQWALQRPGTRHEWPPWDACAQLGSPTFPAPVGRRGLRPRGHRKRTWNPQRYRWHTAANNDHNRPKFGRGTSKVSDPFYLFFFFFGIFSVFDAAAVFYFCFLLLCRLRLAVAKFPELQPIV